MNKPQKVKPMRIHWLFNELREELLSYQSRETMQGDDNWEDMREILSNVDGEHHAFSILDNNRLDAEDAATS